MKGVLTEYECDGRKGRAYQVGEGTPLVYLHSIFGELGPVPIVEELAQLGYSVTAPEIPGFGESDPVLEWYHIADVAYSFRRIFETLEVERAVIVGSSLGGWLAAELAVWCPERVEALALLGALGLRMEEEPVFDLFNAGHRDTMSHAFPHGFDIRSVLAADQQVADIHQLKSLETLARIGWNPYLHDPALRSRLSLVSAPSLVLWGADDGVVPLAHAHKYAELLPGARIEIFPECGHVPALEMPKETTAVLADFLAR